MPPELSKEESSSSSPTSETAHSSSNSVQTSLDRAHVNEPKNAGSGTDSPSEAQNLFQSVLAQFWQRIRSPEATDQPQPLGLVVIMGSSYQGTLTLPHITEAIQRRIWFTYRTGFEPIPKAEDGPSPLSFIGSMIVHGANAHGTISGLFDNSNFTSDVGCG